MESELEDKLYQDIRAILIDPDRLEFGHTQTNMRVGGTTSRLVGLVLPLFRAGQRDALERLEVDDWTVEGEPSVTYKQIEAKLESLKEEKTSED